MTSFLCHRNVLANPLEGVMAELGVRTLRCGEEPPAAVAEAGGLYVHVPFCVSKCRYCGFYSVPTAGRDTGRLVAALLRDLDRYDGIEFRTAYIGGGSPTALPAEQLLALARRIRERFARIEEFTVECNPGQVGIELLWSCGGRVSIGCRSGRNRFMRLSSSCSGAGIASRISAGP